MLQTVFAFLVAVAGWHYMFYSRSAGGLMGLESPAANRFRVRLRRLGGLGMFLLSVFFFAGFHAVDADRPTAAFFLVWATVLLLIMTIVLLAAVDLVLTVRLRRNLRP